MGGFSTCCCSTDDGGCCAGATVPDGWERINTCCFRKASPIAPGEDYFCSPAFRRCTKQASLTIEYYTYNPTVIECTAPDMAGFNQCLEDAQAVGCNGSQVLCGTSRYTIDRTIELYMAGYFEMPEVVTYATRVNCGGVCKWLFQSTYSKGVNYDIVVGGDETYQLEALVENCCTFDEFLDTDDTLGCYHPDGATYTEGHETFRACGQILLDDFPAPGDPLTFSNTGFTECPEGADDWQLCLPECEYGDCPWTLNNPVEEEHTQLLEAAMDALCRDCNLTPSCTNNDQLVTCVNWVHWTDPGTGTEYCQPVVSFTGTRTYQRLTINNESCLDLGDVNLGPASSGFPGECETCVDHGGSVPIALIGDTICTDFAYSLVREDDLDGSVDVPCPDEWSITI